MPRHLPHTLRVCALVLAVLAACSDGGDGPGGNPGTPSEVAFHGEVAAFPDYGYDSGCTPTCG